MYGRIETPTHDVYAWWSVKVTLFFLSCANEEYNKRKRPSCRTFISSEWHSLYLRVNPPQMYKREILSIYVYTNKHLKQGTIKNHHESVKKELYLLDFINVAKGFIILWPFFELPSYQGLRLGQKSLCTKSYNKTWDFRHVFLPVLLKLDLRSKLNNSVWIQARFQKKITLCSQPLLNGSLYWNVDFKFVILSKYYCEWDKRANDYSITQDHKSKSFVTIHKSV